MNASIDGYAQVCIKLSKKEALELDRNAFLEGKIFRTTGETLPLLLKIGNVWRAEGISINMPYELKEQYEIDIPKEGIKRLLKGEEIGTDINCVRLRKVYVSLDTIF